MLTPPNDDDKKKITNKELLEKAKMSVDDLVNDPNCARLEREVTQRKARNKRKATRARLKKKSSQPVVNLDAFRRLRFEAELRNAVSAFYNEEPTSEVLKLIRKAVCRVIDEYARSRSLAKRVEVVIQFHAKSETLLISYWKHGREINVYDVYDAINPGSKKLVGMHVGADGSRRPVMQGDTNNPTT